MSLARLPGRSSPEGCHWLACLDEARPKGCHWLACLDEARPKGERSLAGSTGLEPAASGVTGRRSNQLNYDPELKLSIPRIVADSRQPPRGRWWAVKDSNLRQPACKAGALPLS